MQGDHVVLKCTSTECGMRYPSPKDDPRRNACALCEAPVRVVASFDEPPPHEPSAATTNGELVGVLDNIRSAQNVGTMMRTADGTGLERLVLGGLTAGADNPKVAKTALGAEVAVPSISRRDLLPCLDELRADGYEIWAVDATSDSVALGSVRHRPARLAFIVGNEVAGVDPDVIAGADRRVHIDMRGTKSTLNVAVVFGIVAYWLRDLPIS